MEWLVVVGVVVGVILVLAVIVGVYLRVRYTSLVALRMRVDEAWSEVAAQLRRRADLIPNLVDTVQGYAGHEKQVFDEVTRSRAATVDAQTPAEASAAEDRMQAALKAIFAVAAAYPQLQANQDFLRLQTELVDAEDRIQASRRVYNGGVREFTAKIRVVPNTMFVSRLGSAEPEFFEVDEQAAIAEPPRVQF